MKINFKNKKEKTTKWSRHSSLESKYYNQLNYINVLMDGVGNALVAKWSRHQSDTLGPFWASEFETCFGRNSRLGRLQLPEVMK